MQTNTTASQPKKLLVQVRDKIRFKHYSLSTENTYLSCGDYQQGGLHD